MPEVVAEHEQPLAELLRIVELAAAPAKQPLAPERRKQVGMLVELLAEKFGPIIGVGHFRRAEAAHRHQCRASRHLQPNLDAVAFLRIGNPVDRSQRPLQVADSLLVGAAAQRLVGGSLEVRNGTHRLVGALEMVGKLLGDRVGPALPGRFEPPSDAGMGSDAPAGRQALIQEVAIEIVPEGVEVGARSVGPGSSSRRQDELPRSDRAAHRRPR